jgi:murein DD-endopeptidase MepM/ murein hydrolase activator NlpD
MIVLIAHAGGLVSLYAHLDDRTAPPRVSAGDEVHEGQIIGAVGMTGMTTGPHLHFVVWRDGELVDPLSLFAH